MAHKKPLTVDDEGYEVLDPGRFISQKEGSQIVSMLATHSNEEVCEEFNITKRRLKTICRNPAFSEQFAKVSEYRRAMKCNEIIDDCQEHVLSNIDDVHPKDAAAISKVYYEMMRLDKGQSTDNVAVAARSIDPKDMDKELDRLAEAVKKVKESKKGTEVDES